MQLPLPLPTADQLPLIFLSTPTPLFSNLSRPAAASSGFPCHLRLLPCQHLLPHSPCGSFLQLRVLQAHCPRCLRRRIHPHRRRLRCLCHQPPLEEKKKPCGTIQHRPHSAPDHDTDTDLSHNRPDLHLRQTNLQGHPEPDPQLRSRHRPPSYLLVLALPALKAHCSAVLAFSFLAAPSSSSQSNQTRPGFRAIPKPIPGTFTPRSWRDSNPGAQLSVTSIPSLRQRQRRSGSTQPEGE